MPKTGISLILILILGTTESCKQHHFRSTDYNYSKPQQTGDSLETGVMYNFGMDTTKIVQLTKLILADSFPDIHSLLILKQNKLIYENYFAGDDEIVGQGSVGYINHTIDSLHDCRSVTKSFTSACIGIAIKKRFIKNVNEPIYPWFPEYAEYFDSTKRKITIRDLLTMTSGLEWNGTASSNSKNTESQMETSPNPIRFILSRPMAAEPGKQWNYSGGDAQLLGEILWKASGVKLDKFAQMNLFAPLGIKKYEWLTQIKDMPSAAWGLRLRSRDLANFGLLYINNGRWNNIQILDSSWVEQSLRPLVPRSKEKMTNLGYGLLFWTYSIVIGKDTLNISEAYGKGGQIISICKPLNLVVVFTSGNYNRNDFVNTYFMALKKYILPSIKVRKKEEAD